MEEAEVKLWNKNASIVEGTAAMEMYNCGNLENEIFLRKNENVFIKLSVRLSIQKRD